MDGGDVYDVHQDNIKSTAILLSAQKLRLDIDQLPFCCNRDLCRRLSFVAQNIHFLANALLYQACVAGAYIAHCTLHTRSLTATIQMI